MNKPKSSLEIWLEDAPEIVIATILIGTLGGFCLAMGASAWIMLLALVAAI